MTDTKGNGIMNTAFDGYAPYKGDIQYRKQGSLIAFETGESMAPRTLYCPRAWAVIRGVVKKFTRYGHRTECKTDDIPRLMSARQNITNTRSSSADEALRLTPPEY